MDVAILGAGRGWHLDELERALRARGHRSRVLPISALAASVGGPPGLAAGGQSVQDADAVLPRIIPRGSLEQMVFRVDALHWLESLGPGPSSAR
jgi:ribosomal protein S6--L-glutamate ligase